MTETEAVRQDPVYLVPVSKAEVHTTGTSSGLAPSQQRTGALTDPASEQAGQDAQPLSRRAQKRLVRKQLAKESRVQKRIEKKESQKAAAAKRKEDTQAFVEQLSEQERAEMREKARLKREDRQRDAADKKRRLQEANESGQMIVVDLDFDDMMRESEVRSLCQQLAYCYSVNTHAPCPAHLNFTSLTGRIRSTLQHQSMGLSNWVVTMKEDPYEQLFAHRKADLVYLTPDSQDTLEELDPQKVYIIGGLVDRNRHKGLCQSKADKQGIKSAKLPIEQHLKLAGTRVLTVNQTAAILIHWLECRDWAAALQKAVPERKRAAEKADDDSEAAAVTTQQNADVKREDGG